MAISLPALLHRAIAAALIAGTLALAGTAHAQMAVVDAAGDASLIQQVMTAGKQLASLQQQYQQLTATYEQVTNQYRMLTTFANPNGMARELETPFLQNPLPTTSSLPGLLTGGSGLGASPYAQQFLGANGGFSSTATTPGAQLMNTQASSLAAIEGLATTNLASVEQRIAGLSDLQGQLDSATTIQQVASVNARIAAEQTYIGAQQVQAANLQAIATAQVAAQQQAQQQMVSQQAAQTAAQFPVSVP